MAPRLRSIARVLVLVIGAAHPALGVAGELETLIEEYSSAKAKPAGNRKGGNGWGGGGGRWNRGQAEDPVKAILLQIAALGSPPALAFLQGEYVKERPEIAAACVEPILSFPDAKLPEFLLSNFPKRDRLVKKEVLLRLGNSTRELLPLEGALAGILRSEQNEEVRLEFPRILGKKIGTVSAAKALLTSLRPTDRPGAASGKKASAPGGPPAAGGPPGGPPGGGGFGGPGGPRGGPGGPRGWGGRSEEPADFPGRVVAALKDPRDDVRAWLAGDAYNDAPPVRVEVLARLAGEMKLEAARPRLEKHLASPEDGAALRCLEAIIELGAAASDARIAEALKKGKHGLAFRIRGLDCLAASGSPSAVEAVMSAARDPSPETRSIAVGSLALVPGMTEGAVGAILAALKDHDPGVRMAAIRALKDIRRKEMVVALIDHLGVEREERIKVEGLKLLIKVTGQNMGLAVEDWRKWWDVAQASFEFKKDKDDVAAAGARADAPAGGPEAGPAPGAAKGVAADAGEAPRGSPGKRGTEARVRDLKYFGVEVNSKRVAFLLDASLSMDEEMEVSLHLGRSAEGKKTTTEPRAGEEEKAGRRIRAKKIDVLKKEMVRLLGELPDDVQLNLITFADSYRSWQEGLQPLADGGREKVISFVRAITMGRGTNVFDTLEFALKDKRVDTVFLLTDGIPMGGKITDPPSILKEVQVLNRVRGVVIHCIAFGEQSPFLRDLARQNGGDYRFVNSY